MTKSLFENNKKLGTGGNKGAKKEKLIINSFVALYKKQITFTILLLCCL